MVRPGRGEPSQSGCGCRELAASAGFKGGIAWQGNPRRAALKRQVNDLLGSEIIEEKGYTTNTANAR